MCCCCCMAAAPLLHRGEVSSVLEIELHVTLLEHADIVGRLVQDARLVGLDRTAGALQKLAQVLNLLRYLEAPSLLALVALEPPLIVHGLSVGPELDRPVIAVHVIVLLAVALRVLATRGARTTRAAAAPALRRRSAAARARRGVHAPRRRRAGTRGQAARDAHRDEARAGHAGGSREAAGRGPAGWYGVRPIGPPRQRAAGRPPGAPVTMLRRRLGARPGGDRRPAADARGAPTSDCGMRMGRAAPLDSRRARLVVRRTAARRADAPRAGWRCCRDRRARRRAGHGDVPPAPARLLASAAPGGSARPSVMPAPPGSP